MADSAEGVRSLLLTAHRLLPTSGTPFCSPGMSVGTDSVTTTWPPDALRESLPLSSPRRGSTPALSSGLARFPTR